MKRVATIAVAAVVVVAAAFVVLMPKGPGPDGALPPDHESPADTTPKAACQHLCGQRLAEGADLSDGPCLSNSISPGWVCDVAHSPRQEVDNDPANQCPEYGRSAGHFVEVTPGCELIRGV